MLCKRILPFLLALLLPCVTLAQKVPTLVFVRINEAIMPIERGHKYEDPLDEALKTAKLGVVTGGGTSLSKERNIEWVGIDVSLIDLDRGIPFLKQKLIDLGAPQGSILEYQLQGRKIEVQVRAQ
ncbi:hypothetical protein WS97_09680 [Burkholderia territorii]|nr:hypothetical protein WS79_21125 [Burkholderia territorii]KVL37520.1 hypothetical protein WS97_09680 [Burkholderia territorii]KWO51774.1 hypothetical protein WT98_12810 [Burkholderia territorii]